MSTAPTAPAKPKRFTFRANDGSVDRYGDRLNPNGWILDGFKKNPVVLLNHQDGAYTDVPVLPIGKATAVWASSDALMCEIELDQGDALALECERKIEAGLLNAVSVRYLMTGDVTSNGLGGVDSSENELLEISLVNVPGNANATRVKAGNDLKTRTLLATRAPNLPNRENPSAIPATANKGASRMEQTEAQIEARIEAAKQAGVDEAMNKIMGEARGQRSLFQKASVDSVMEPPAKKAGRLGAWAISWLNSKGGADRSEMASQLRSFGQHDMAKSVQSGVYAHGGAGIPLQLSEEWIELLVAKPVISQLGARRMPFKGRMEIGRTDVGPTAQWVGEGVQITKSTPSTTRIALTSKKLAILCDVSNDILRNPKAGYADVQLESDMMTVAASEIDRQGLNGTGTLGKPLGIIGQIPAAQSFVKAGTTFANYLADVDKLVKTVDDTNRPRVRRGFLMGTAVESTLLGVRDGAVGGQFAFREAMLANHMLRGFPYAVSTWMPTTHLVFGEFDDLIYGVDTEMELAVAPAGDRFAFDETSFRLIASVDFALRHTNSFACINNYP